VLGSVIPSLSTLAEPSAADLADLAAAIDEAGVPAVFADTSSPSRLAEALAAEGTDVEVVELFGESLGPDGSGGETYVEMVRTNAHRIADALRA
jgi:zinc/manganese transport system substrate-binding protein